MGTVENGNLLRYVVMSVIPTVIGMVSGLSKNFRIEKREMRKVVLVIMFAPSKQFSSL